MMAYVYVALGGALGAVIRYFVQSNAQVWFGKGFPFGTLAVNVLGSFLLGLFYALMQDQSNADTPLRAFFAIGLLGAFTTFSTFSVDTLMLLQQGEWLKGLTNILLNVTVCIIAAAVGINLFKG